MNLQPKITRALYLVFANSLILLIFGFVLSQLSKTNAVTAAYPPPSTPQSPPSSQGSFRIYLPIVLKNYKTPPKSTDSVYITTMDSGRLYSLGQTYGISGTSGLVILDFGNPRVFSGPRYCTKLLGQSIFPCTPEIITATRSFMSGWWYGYNYQGGSTRNPNAFITVAVGVNNCGTGGVSTNPNNPCVPGGTHMPPAHGRAWAQMVRDIENWVNSQGYASRIAVAAANDMEPAWNYNYITTQWVMSYTAGLTTTVYLYNFGSCDGCTYARPDGTICTNCVTMTYQVTTTTGTVTWQWHLNDVRYISWDAVYNYPAPQIYLTDGTNALQWYGVSRYTYDTRGVRILFKGSLTTSKRFGNSPEAGWLQLWGRLYDDPLTRLSDIPWSTDIDFQR